ncbi:MAG: 50S ribosomal protein L11 methyltransferase [Succiniclasticum sp.]|uniref:50S ribosomal protein L11 methyltransferase n=1 Tax=Succiniclasticum sp. TaxID=2775030 RepID=UPI002A90E7E9|nr:50S ribosomal protein L11 methyltransferase [Succiniclasticum sp.]MBR1495226.1 50S ribosomal protein L11 methyltransferase [Acidaminococcaceae bacterium]MDY6290131.1 50S ribosomal protein L11 methyltransferase [Succiniclasticum sp.]
MEKWLEVSVKVNHEAEEVTAEILREAGARNGVAIEDPVLYETLRNSLPFELCDPLPENTDFSVVTITAYYPEDTELTERLQKIEAELAAVEKRIGKFRFGPALFRHVTEEDWSDEWKQYFHVTRVGKHIVIKPSWEDYAPEPEDVVLELDPGMAFGTGTHPTTVLVLEALEKMIRPDTTVFDVGTGSGILAMTAAKLGAKNVKAVDIDGVAVRTAKENIEKAGMQDRIEVRQGDLLHGTEGKADVIVANILADIIIMLLPDIPGKMKEGGLFFASGIIEDYQQDVTEAAEKAGLRVKETTRIKDWVGLLMEKAGKKGTA